MNIIDNSMNNKHNKTCVKTPFRRILVMALPTYRLSLRLFSIALSVELVLTTVLSTGAQEPSNRVPGKLNLPSSLIAQVTFDPPGPGEPDDSAGGASRDGGKCTQEAERLSPSVTPLRPANQQGLTVAERPTFFVYVPETSAKKSFFTLKDKTEDYYYQATLPLPQSSGIVSFQLPSEAPALTVGKSYAWTFVTICGQKLAVDDPSVGGQIQRIEPNPHLTNQLKNVSPLERAALYGAKGIWYDTVATLAELKRSQPHNSTLAATWENLLKSVGLEAIATQPLLK